MPLLAGAASTTVSPLPEHLAAGVYLGGYGSYRARLAEGLHDDLFCRAFALSDGDQTTLLLALDLVGLRPRWLLDLRRAIARAHRLPLEAVFVASTHSHASPDTQGLWGGVPDAYLRYVHGRCLETARDALAGLGEARVEAATIAVDGLVRNRRGWDETDTTMTVLRARLADGSTIASLVNFACHPTVLPGENLSVSCDFPAGLVAAIEEGLGGVAVYVNGAQGDVNPARNGGFPDATEMGRDLAGIAARALEQATPLEPPLTVRERRLAIPFRVDRVPKAALPILAVALPLVRQAARRGVLRRVCNAAADRGQNETAQVLSALAMAAEESLVSTGFETEVRTRVGWLSIGDSLQGLAAPGEVLTRLALPVKGALTGPHRLFLGLTNDTLGYFLPTDEWLTGRNDNYEESVSPGRAAGPALASALQTLISEA